MLNYRPGILLRALYTLFHQISKKKKCLTTYPHFADKEAEFQRS